MRWLSVSASALMAEALRPDASRMQVSLIYRVSGSFPAAPAVPAPAAALKLTLQVCKTSRVQIQALSPSHIGCGECGTCIQWIGNTCRTCTQCIHGCPALSVKSLAAVPDGGHACSWHGTMLLCAELKGFLQWDPASLRHLWTISRCRVTAWRHAPSRWLHGQHLGLRRCYVGTKKDNPRMTQLPQSA